MSKSTLFFRETLPSSADSGAKVLLFFEYTKDSVLFLQKRVIFQYFVKKS